MKIDAVFSGGGVKAFAFLGALQSIKQNDLQIERVAGTSAGAIIAALIAANYNVSEIREMIEELDLNDFLDPPKLSTVLPFSKWLLLYYQMGFNKGDKLEKWLEQVLITKNIRTFQDLKEGYFKVVVSDLSLGKLVVIPDDLERIYGISSNSFPVSKAIRMSAGYPFFFMPTKLTGKKKQKSIIVDGGLLSNFPIWIFENEMGDNKRPTIGVKLSGSNDIQRDNINNAIDMLQALISTMKQAHDERYISKQNFKNIISIPTDGVQTVDLDIDKMAKEKLVQAGKIRADEFLNFWPN